MSRYSSRRRRQETGWPETFAGTLRFDDGSSIPFLDLSSLIFTIDDGEESIPQNANEWPRHFDPDSRSRSAPLAWITSIEVRAGEARPSYRALFEPEVEITTTTGVRIVSRYKTLEWVRLKVADGNDIVDRYIYFAGEDGRRIARIELSR